MATSEQTYSPAAETHEPIITQALTRPYALNWEIVLYAVILVAALVTRFADLGERVMSHDESLHTYYSWRLSEFGEFSHTPLMHGPLLFHMTALNYFLFGDNDFTARIYPAALGVLIVLFPALLRRWLGRTGALITSVLLMISPQLLYYNRYIRHDTPTIFFALLVFYAILQYVDSDRPRRPLWMWVMSGALLGMLASKEVAFIYIAIFASFMGLFWLARVVQDVEIQRRPHNDPGWEPPPLQRWAGRALMVALVAVVALALGGLLRYMLSSTLWMPSDRWIVAGLFLVMIIPLALSGVLSGGLLSPRALPSDEKPKRRAGRRGAAGWIMEGLADGRSAFTIIAAGLIIGALLALLVVCALDVIKPQQVWTETVVRSANDSQTAGNLTKEFTISRGFDSAMFVRLITWIGLPVLVLLFVLFLTAVYKYPGDVPLPWRELLLIVLVAFITTTTLVMLERSSHVETDDTPFAADPNAVVEDANGDYNNNWIIAAWIIGVLVAGGVAASRYLTNWWDFLNRQPIFDVLVVIFTLILPWAAAYPLYRAGYNLEDYNSYSQEGRDTLEASLLIVVPFFLVSAAIGLSWNWKRWLPAAAIFLALFGFFFTTVFSNQYGLVTGMIGSLGYWLEQQGVRRGSQPQYYYVLTQLPVYEFLPMIGALLAGLTGLTSLWGWRRERTIAAIQARRAAEWGTPGDDDALADSLPLPDLIPFAEPDDGAADSGVALSEEDLMPVLEGVDLAEQPDLPPADPDTEPVRVVRYSGLAARLVRPFSVEEESAHRQSNPEWIGAFPFMTLVGWWAIMMVFSLTVAGEKMPWLTTHLTVPLILLTGWWLGRVAGQVRWQWVGTVEWLVLLVALPVAFLAFSQVALGFWGADPPFRGREVEDLLASGNWLAALLVFLGVLYVVGHFGNRLGPAQLGRLAILSGAMLLAILTARVAYVASFINYDYATEFLVYAHAGPAVKTVLNEVERIATITNEDTSMRIVFDDESSWPFSWYFRDYTNYALLRGEAGSVDPTQLDGARVVVVGNKKAGDIRRILGDRYYEFGYIRLWWPMQEYFGLTYQRFTNVFSTSDNNIAARFYREGIWDIWWDRDYRTYAQAMCIEAKQFRCDQEAQYGTSDDERSYFRNTCEQAVISECVNDDRFEVNKWPVSDRLYFFVDKQIAAQVWDAGIGSSTVNIREPEYPEDLVYLDAPAERTLGETAEMVEPRGIALDEDGFVYLADTRRSRVVVLDAEGALVRVIAEQGAVPDDTGLREPWGLDVGPDGNLYIADTWNNRVAVYTPEGEFVRAWGHEGRPFDDPSFEAMWGPRDVKIGPDGNVYVADTGGKRIRVYTLDGEWVRDIGSGGSQLGQLDEPVGLAFNPVSGELYVAEAWNRRIQVFDATGVPQRSFTVNMWFTNRQSYNRPYIAVSPDGSLIYVTDMDDRQRIVAYNLMGQPVLSFDQPDDLVNGVLGLRSPAGLAVDAAGRLYVVDADQAKVFVFPPSQVSGGAPPLSPDDQGEAPGVPSEWESTPQEDLGEESNGDAPVDISPLDESGSDESGADDLSSGDDTGPQLTPQG